MDIDTIMEYCGQFPQATVDYPFGEQPTCFRVLGKIFAHVYPVGIEGALRIVLEDQSIPREEVAPMLILRCEPFQGDFYRRQYPGAVLRPYHSPPQQQPYANTVLLDKDIPDDAIKEMILHAYRVVLGRLPKKKSAPLLARLEGRAPGENPSPNRKGEQP